jgi:hypothetical protein
MKNYLKALPVLAFAALIALNCCKPKDKTTSPAGPSGNCQLIQVSGNNYQYQISYNSNGQVDKFIEYPDTMYYEYNSKGQASRIWLRHNNKEVYDYTYDANGHVTHVMQNSISPTGTDSLPVESYDITYTSSKLASITYTNYFFPEKGFTGTVTFDSKMNPVSISYSDQAKNDFVINMQYDNNANVMPFLDVTHFPSKLFIPANNVTAIYNIEHDSQAKDSLLTTSTYTNTYSNNYLTNSVLKYNKQYSDTAKAIDNETISSDYKYNCK